MAGAEAIGAARGPARHVTPGTGRGTNLLKQFTPRGGRGRLSGIELSAGQGETDAAHAVTVLPQHNDAPLRRFRDNADEFAGFDVVVIVDHAAIGQSHFFHRNLEEGRGGIDFVLPENAPGLDHRESGPSCNALDPSTISILGLSP